MCHQATSISATLFAVVVRDQGGGIQYLLPAARTKCSKQADASLHQKGPDYSLVS